ncbi:MAG TPA: glycoside hydrolase family 3 N-terminal domain-containing protein [Candidatus Megaira endosymbiont of Hartmannula sinica]|nr:glycoside hydrolase family 3 N-terminal domain-containing protein [Candidatus Megaera endosymbiont of Hartmannula sinica]
MKNKIDNITVIPIVFGISSYKLTSEEVEIFTNKIPYGIILFSRNINSKTQLIDLVTSIKNINSNIKIFVDQEGGVVQRIKYPLISQDYPCPRYFGDIYQKDKEKAISLVRKNYASLAADLRNFNIDSPCAPVSDLLYEYTDDVINTRSFSQDQNIVYDLSVIAIEKIIEQDLIAFLKHIPGHGRAVCDSHKDLPVIDSALSDLERADFKIFSDLAKNFASEQNLYAMTAHIIYKNIDSKYPITLSKAGIRYIRNNIGFQGKIMTDDICMKALPIAFGYSGSLENKLIDITKRIVDKSLKAQVDIILHCSGNIAQIKAISSLF